ncbi:MAG: ABC transporter ATP-binding protein [Melioribacteraceae bacterium]|nr:ABC transporter ATP-binding protein [Melioribacteraceae bacterium]
MIRTEKLNRIYDGTAVPVHATSDVSLNFDKGEFTALVGPSGCGKTTLLNLIGGLDTPTSGEVFVEDIKLSSLSGRELIDFRLNNIGFVFQAYNLIPVLTARENVEFILHLQGAEKSARKTRVEELLHKVGLKDKMDQRPSVLSGGEQQRVAVARALASKPTFVLADEPTANLDSAATKNLLDIMLRLNQEDNITFIFSTHDSRVIKRARRLVTLDDGKVISDEVVG